MKLTLEKSLLLWEAQGACGSSVDLRAGSSSHLALFRLVSRAEEAVCSAAGSASLRGASHEAGGLASHDDGLHVGQGSRGLGWAGGPPRLLCPWDSPGKNTGVGCHFLLQGIVPTQCNADDLDSIPESGRTPGRAYGNSLQYSCLENSTDRWGRKESDTIERLN